MQDITPKSFIWGSALYTTIRQMVAGSNAKQAALLAAIAAIAILLSIISYQYYSATAQEIREIATTSI